MRGAQIVTSATAMELCVPLLEAPFRIVIKRPLDYLLLGSFWLLDNFLGAIYFVLDVTFEGAEANRAKNVILPHALSSTSSALSSSFSSSSSSSSPLRSSSRSSLDEDNILFHDFISCVDHDRLQDLSMSSPPSAPETTERSYHNSKPRRAGIIAERQQNSAKTFSYGEGAAAPCTCWGWEVAEESCLEDQQNSLQQQLEGGDDDEDDDGDDGDDKAFRDMKVRWSECQCPDCRKLWMPMSKARSRLHVQTWNVCDCSNDFEPNRNVRKSQSLKSLSGISKDEFEREQNFVWRRRQSLRRSVSTDSGASACWRCSSNSNFVNGAKSELQRSLKFSSRNGAADAKKSSTTGVIFLHGIFSSSDFWFDSNVVPLLDGEIKSRHLILAPDLLGCGRSPRPHDSVYTLSDQVDALESSLLKKHALESFHIVGHSMGTIPALALAARFPNRVRSLTLIAPVYAGYTDPKQGGDEILTDCNSILSFQDPWSMRALRSLTASEHYNINRFLGHLLFSRHQLLVPIFQSLLRNRWPRSFVRDYLAVTHDAAWHIVHNTMIGGSHALVPALRKLRDRGMRVFVIHGTDDTSCPFKQSMLMTEHFDNVVLAPVPGKGHVDVVLGRDYKVLTLLEDEIRLGDRNLTKSPAKPFAKLEASISTDRES